MDRRLRDTTEPKLRMFANMYGLPTVFVGMFLIFTFLGSRELFSEIRALRHDTAAAIHDLKNSQEKMIKLNDDALRALINENKTAWENSLKAVLEEVRRKP